MPLRNSSIDFTPKSFNNNTAKPINTTSLTKYNANATTVINCAYLLFPKLSSEILNFKSLAYYQEVQVTLSPLQIHEKFCIDNNWDNNLDISKCVNPCDECFIRILNLTNEYFTCQGFMNIQTPLKFQNEPMSFALYLNSFGMQLNQFNYKNCKDFSQYQLFSNFIWNMGQPFRYGDMRVPDYSLPNLFTDRKWDGRNDTIEAPYGNLPRGIYTYTVIIYKNLTNNVIPEENTRFKNEWPDLHPIISGIFIDERVETDLIYNKSYVINSAIISIDIQGKDYPKNPLPGEMIISFTHYNRTYRNPVCIYWQPVSSSAGVLPSSGYWSNYGMRVFKTNTSMTVCRSTHGGIFSLLMEPSIDPPPKPIDPLDAMNIFLTLVAAVIFFLYIFAIFLLRCAKDAYNRIHISIAFSCMLSQMVFLGSWGWKDNWDRCTSCSTVIEFFHVATISWIMIEAVHQLSNLRYFFNKTTSSESFYHIIGWGFPLAVTIALLGFPYQQYTELRYCWPYLKDLEIWYFGGPILVVLLVIISLKFITIMEIQKAPEKLAKDINYQRAERSNLSSLAITPTFCMMWILSTFAISSSSKIFQDVAMIVVPIINIILALEVMYFYFYRNDDVIDSLQYEMRIREKEKLKSYDYMRGLNMRVAYKTKNNEPEEDDNSITYDEGNVEIQKTDLKFFNQKSSKFI